MKLNYHSSRQFTGVWRSHDDADRLLAAEMMAKLKRGGDVRADKVAHLRESLDADEYENDLKLDIAAMKLWEDLETDSAD